MDEHGEKRMKVDKHGWKWMDKCGWKWKVDENICGASLLTLVHFFQLFRQSGNPWISLGMNPGKEGVLFKLTVMWLPDSYLYYASMSLILLTWFWEIIHENMSKSLVSYIWWFFRLIHNHNNHNSQLNPCPTNELGSQLCGHWLCSQPLDGCGERKKAGRQSLSNSDRSSIEKLMIFKLYQGLLYQCKNNVSNMNIFSKQLTYPEMVSRTAGDNCGKADGDYLAWESAEWVLKGEASFGEVGVKDLCGRDGSTFFQLLIYWRTLNDWRNGGAWCSSDVVWGCLGGVWVLVYLGGILGCQSCSGGNLRVQSMQNWAALKQTHHFGTTLKCSRRFRKCGTYWAFLLNFVVWFHIVCDRFDIH